MDFAHFYKMLATITAAADAELTAQTPPRGGDGPRYHCPACAQERTTRGEMRSHLTICEEYRDFIVGCVRRADLQTNPKLITHPSTTR